VCARFEALSARRERPLPIEQEVAARGQENIDEANGWEERQNIDERMEGEERQNIDERMGQTTSESHIATSHREKKTRTVCSLCTYSSGILF